MEKKAPKECVGFKGFMATPSSQASAARMSVLPPRRDSMQGYAAEGQGYPAGLRGPLSDAAEFPIRAGPQVASETV